MLNLGLLPERMADSSVFAIRAERRRNAPSLEVESCRVFPCSMATSSAAMEEQGTRQAVAHADSEQPAISGRPDPRSLAGMAPEAKDLPFAGQTEDRNSVKDSAIGLDLRGSLLREILHLPGDESNPAAKQDLILHRRSVFDL